MQKTQSLASVLLLVLFLVGCAPKAAPPSELQAPATAAPVAAVPVATAGPTASPVKPAWQEEWDKTLEAARREGTLSLATTGGSEIRNSLMVGFKAAYGIPLEAISGRSDELSSKIFAERRAGLRLYDVYVGGSAPIINTLKPAGTFDPLPQALILPDVTEPEVIKRTWYQGELSWLDKGRIALVTSLSPIYPIAINTNLVKEGDIKSWRDLLQPKWQGKVALNDPIIAGQGTNAAQFADEKLGWDYFVELVKTKPLVLTDQRLMIDWLAHDKVAIVVGPKVDVLAEFVKAGAPVRGLVPQEGTWMAGGATTLCIFNKPAHPSAAKVFVNWLLSKEGLTILTRAGGGHMTRLDVPTEHLLPEELRDPKVNYFNTATEDVALRKPALVQKAKEVLAPLRAK